MSILLFFIPLFVLLIYLLFPKAFLIEIRIEKVTLIKLKFNILGIYVTVFSKRVSLSVSGVAEKYILGKKERRKKGRGISVKGLAGVIKAVALSSVIRLERIFGRVWYEDAFVLSILSASIYSIWGILISCGQNTELDYKAFLRKGFSSSVIQLDFYVKIIPVKLFCTLCKAIKKQKGGVAVGSSN